MRNVTSFLVGVVLTAAAMIVLIAGCTPVNVQGIYDAKADNERARAAAEWARTAQTQAEAAAAAQEAQAAAAAAMTQAPVRAQAQTTALVGLLAVGVLVAAGCGGALVWWMMTRARLVFADRVGLYPVVMGSAPITNLNEPGAQHAAIAPQRAPVQVLPAVEVEAIPVIPPPIELDARRLQHIERLLLQPPAEVEHEPN